MADRCRLAGAFLVVAWCSLVLHATQGDPAALFDQANALSITRDLAKARDLFVEAADRDPFPVRRDRAAIRAAQLEWHVFQNADKARTLLARVADTSDDSSAAWTERAYLEIELARDYAAARNAARTARERARNLVDREAAVVAAGAAVVAESRPARLGGTCPDDGARVAEALADLLRVIQDGGPVIQSSRTALNLALMKHDQETVTRTLRWYFGDSSASRPAVTLADRPAAARALGAATLWPEAELALLDACATNRAAAAPDAATRDVLAYTTSLDRLERLTRDHYRNVGRGIKDDGPFNRGVGDEHRSLWRELSWPGDVPSFSDQAFTAEIGRRFGAVKSLGETDGIPTLLYGHKIVDESREVEQYGQKASLRFVQLDGMLSSGYSVWATRGRIGTAGWIGTDAIYQIRPRYADGPTNRWRRLTDPDVKKRRDQDMADETRRDDERIKAGPIVALRGLDMRLERQASEALRAELVAKGLAGDALRDAFLERARDDDFAASIWAHEGRHAIDKLVFKISNAAELEFRAKLSEAALARVPRGALGSILAPIGPPTAHGVANARVLRGVVDWMAAHAKEIASFDPGAPALPQLDKLTDAQIRLAMRSMDPIVK